MFNHQKMISQDVPAAKYDQLGGFKLTKPKPFVLKIMPDKDIGKDKYKIVKSKNIDCGSYDPLKSFRTTQLHGFEVKGYIGKSPKKNYIDDIIRGCYLAFIKGRQDEYMLCSKKQYTILQG